MTQMKVLGEYFVQPLIIDYLRLNESIDFIFDITELENMAKMSMKRLYTRHKSILQYYVHKLRPT